MQAILIFALLVVVVNGFICPRINTTKSKTSKCWDGSDGKFGCCRTGPHCLKPAGCDCKSECRGFTISVHVNASFNFTKNPTKKDKYIKNATVIHGKNDACETLREPAVSARVVAESCGKLWEKAGCSGKSIKLTNGTIKNITSTGIFKIRAVSSCKFSAPRTMNVTIYQNNIFSAFGSNEVMLIKERECKFVGEWWKDRVSMISSSSIHCYKIWEGRDCTGKSKCNCEQGNLHLKVDSLFSENSSIDWNNRVRALSWCNYAG